MKILLASIIALSSVTPAMAHHSQRGYSASRECYKTVYKEEYIPGTRNNPGYIKTYNETVAVPCANDRPYVQRGTTVEYRSVSRSSTSLVVLPILTILGIAGLVRT